MEAPLYDVFRITDPHINTASQEHMGCTSKDGREIFFTRDHWQLWTAEFNVPGRPEEGFTLERPLNEICVPGVPAKSPSLSPCGGYLAWSDWPSRWGGGSPPRPGGLSPSTSDIWIARRGRSPAGDAWLDFQVVDVKNLRAPVNSSQHEISPHFSNDGETLLIVSDRRQNSDELTGGEFLELPITGDLCLLHDDRFSPAVSFRRGDSNDDGQVDISDAAYHLNWLFLGGASPGCIAATSANGDAAADLSDAVYLPGHLFLGGPAPAESLPECGPGTLEADKTLGCEAPPGSCPGP